MLTLQFSYIISALCLPILLLIYNHPNRFIKWVTRIALIGLIFYLIAVVPIVILTDLKLWALLLIILPVIFRVLSLILTKIGFFGSKSREIAVNLLYASVSTLNVVFVGAYLNILEKLFFLIVILLMLFISDFRIIEKYKYMGTLFGPIIAVIPTYDSFNVFLTVVAIWLVMTVSLDLILKLFRIQKSKHIEKSTLIIFVPISLIVAHNGGIQIDWEITFLKILAFLGIVCLIMGSSFIVNEKVRNVYVKQYYPVIISNAFLIFLLVMVSRSEGVKDFFDSSLALIVVVCLIVSLCRLISPLDKLTNTMASYPFKMSSMNDLMIMVFGKRLGQSLFNNLFGLDYKSIHIGFSAGLFLLFVAIGGSLLRTGYPDTGLTILFQEESNLLVFITAISMFSAVVVISELIRVSNKKIKDKGLSKEDAIHSSTLITLEYFFTFVPLLYFVIKDFENINTAFVAVGIIYLILLYVNINMFLYFDFKEPHYNNFNRVRLVLAALLQGIAIGTAPLLFFLDYKDDGFLFVNQYNSTVFLLSFLAMIPAKLLGYDTEYGSKKAYKRSWLMLVCLYISIQGMGYFPLFVYMVIQDESTTVYISVLLNIIIISSFGRELAMVLLPWSNRSDKSVIQDWSLMLKELRSAKTKKKPQKA